MGGAKMKVVISDETICEEIDQYRRTWKFECGCEASGVFAGITTVSGGGIRLHTCESHTPPEPVDEPYGVIEFGSMEKLLEYMEKIIGEELEFEFETGSWNLE
jgi:hypothetical protein